MCFGIKQLRDSVEKSILPNKLCQEIASSNAPPGSQRNTHLDHYWSIASLDAYLRKVIDGNQC